MLDFDNRDSKSADTLDVRGITYALECQNAAPDTLWVCCIALQHTL